MRSPGPLAFGIYPFGMVGGPNGLISGPADDIGRIGQALADLAGDGPPLLVRLYVTYEGSAAAPLEQVAQFAQIGNVVDLSLNFHDRRGDTDGWCSFVDQVVRAHGRAVGSIGVTNEANLTTVPFAPDGAYPRAMEALVDGVLVAAEAKVTTGATAALGFTAAGDLDATTRPDTFWQDVARRGGQAFATPLDFAGLTMYPGGFGSPASSTTELVERTSTSIRSYRANLGTAGIPLSVPIRVSECGWPTGPARSDADQAEALTTIVRTVARLQSELEVSHFELFTLRDADSGSPDPFGHLGILRDDYSPKPAYGALRTLMADLRSRSSAAPSARAAREVRVER